MSLWLWRCPFLRDTLLKEAQSSHPTPVPKAQDLWPDVAMHLKIMKLTMMTGNTQVALFI